MATDAVQDEKPSELLQCSVCNDFFNDPRTLPCLHTFCYKCIADWCEDKKPGDKVACSQCRQEFAIPESGIDGLKKNSFFGNLLNLNEVKQEYQRMCEVCPGPKKKTSQKFCLDCEQSYCESCSDCHMKIKICSSHKLVNLDELQSDIDIYKKNRLNFCHKHTDEQIKLYCFEDKVAICSMCFFLDHRSHRCEEMMKVADEFRAGQQIQDLQTAIGEVAKNIEVLHSRKLSFLDQVKNVENQITEKAEQLIKVIRNHKQNLITELHKIKSNHEREIGSVNKQFTNAKSLLTTFTNYCDELLKEGSDIVICQEADGVRKQIEKLVNMKTLEDLLTNLNVINVVFSHSISNFDDTKTILGQVKAEIIPTLSHTLADDDKGITALTLMNHELFVTRHKNKHVSIYDSSTLQWKRNIPVPQLGLRAYGLAACPLNRVLFVSDWNNECVYRVDLQNYGVTSWKVAKYPSGLSINSRHNVIVTCDNKITEYSPTGAVLRDLSDNKYVMWQAVETANGTLIVSRCGSTTHGVAELSWGLQTLRCYGNQAGSGQCQMKFPCSLALDSGGNVIVADSYNNRLQVLDSSLTTAHSLKLPADGDLVRPVAMCYDEARGRLFVGEHSGLNRLMVFDHVTNLNAMLT